jgi:GNAT superfamily N-acetyltransferase
MIRPAKFADTPAIERLLRRVHAKSKYAKLTPLNEKALNQVVLSMIAGQNQSGPEATFVVVAEHQGKVQGFMAASLNRIYGICDKLTASDSFIISESRKASDTVAMIDAYIEWAKSNPKVVEIILTWSDAVPGGQKMAKLYTRKGFRQVGEFYEMDYEMRMHRTVWEEAA